MQIAEIVDIKRAAGRIEEGSPLSGLARLHIDVAQAGDHAFAERVTQPTEQDGRTQRRGLDGVAS